MKDQKEIWKSEQLIWNEQQKELKEKTDKDRKREEEEYAYTLKLTRKKETDLYEEKKASLGKELTEKKIAFDKEIANREAEVVSVENELKELRAKSTAFPFELEKTVTTSVKSATDKLEAEFRFEKEQTIETLKSKIKDMDAIIGELSKKAVTAETSVKDIAMKAIESAGKMQIISNSKESAGKE